MTASIPVLMYHSVGIVNEEWQWNYLTCPHEIFENHLIVLKKHNYKTVTLNELYDYMMHDVALPLKSVIITFDDGYLDNWIFAYPLLKKHGMCGTVFVNPDFVDNRNIVRKRSDQLAQTSSHERQGFLSWDELRLMEQDGVIFTESHALSHTWYPNTEKIVDFRHPGDNYIWMTWNQYPEQKPYLQIDNAKLIAFGQPVYAYEKSLSAPRYYPDKRLDAYLTNYVKNNGSNNFFSRPNWRNILFSEVNSYKAKYLINDRYETLQEYKVRINYELKQTKEKIERELNKKIFFLCWPGGSATKLGMKIAEDIGYRFYSAARDLSTKERRAIVNSKGCKSNRITRFAPVLYFNGKENFNSKILYARGFNFYLQILGYKYRSLFYIYKLYQRIITLIYNDKHL